MLPVSNIQRDQPGAEEFRARFDEMIAETLAGIPEDRREHAIITAYDDVKFATGVVTHGFGTLFVQVSEALVTQTGGDPEVTIQEEAYMVMMNAGNREPQAFTRVEPGA